MTTPQTRQTAKDALRRTLADHAGDTKHKAVMAAIQDLVQLNPTSAPARNAALRDGNWLLINAPNFPDGELQADGRHLYTLGRLAFNMFQPKTLKVAIDRVFQPILPIDDTQRTHDIWVDFTIADDAVPPLKGVVRNLGVCQPYSDDSLQVRFTGGVLTPQQDTDLEAWKQVFGNQTRASRTVRTPLKERLKGFFLKLMFGLVSPEGMNPGTGEVSFTMKRSPKGTLQILYLDEELRITKGERGTVLVCDRQD
ncbi:MAG: PAP/fibrillin family protein [Leptolyngbyaceae cyanobacterium MO_188.B28]|nr:PAP/fibrillin family protein [Leptolyngbyaceae cyanobacterium MO_188.B28]